MPPNDDSNSVDLRIVPKSEGYIAPSPPYRPYYNERNALSLKPKFDQLLGARQSCVITDRCSMSTLQTKLNDGLKWLCLEWSGDREPYLLLRQLVTFRRFEQHIECVLKSEDTKSLVVRNEAIVMTPIADDATKVTWLDTFAEWLGVAKEMAIFDSLTVYKGAIRINPEDEIALVRLCAPLGAELDINPNKQSFRVAR